MKGKLHKMVSGYILSLNGDIDDPYAIVNEELAKDYEWYKLSLKNCQEIERGYDLDELAETFAKNHSIYPTAQDDTEYGFKNGFQKALEILGDKKFSEEQLREAFFHVQNEPTFDVFKQSLQQTEWDVEIEMEPYHDCEFVDDGKTHIFEPKWKPLLDENGCLILKKL